MGKPLSWFIFYLCLVGKVFCFIPNQLVGLASVSSTFHTEMTEKAFIRHAADYFNSLQDPRFQPVAGSDAEDLFKGFYGAGADWKGFEDVIETIKGHCASIDSDKATKKNPKWHFDSERIVEGHEHLTQQGRTVVRLIQLGDYDAARETLGRMLHPLQDFYTHTNWIEMGQTIINRNLGVEGKELGEAVAQPEEQTCVDCSKDFSSRLKSGLLKLSLVGLVFGSVGGDEDNIFNCVDNVVVERKLTSGYSVNQKDDFGAPVNKPPAVGKCSHGGTLDGSSGEHAVGGMNKDGENGLFSPHDYLHSTAAIYAENATLYYLNYLRERVGDDAKWASFLQLLSGSSVAFVVDISQSMYEYVEKVKGKIRRTVEQYSQHDTAPSEYIFIPFSQNLAGPIYAEANKDEVNAFLDSFKKDEHLDKTAETSMRKMYEAILMGAQRSSIGGVIYAITNGVPSDSQLMPWLDETLRKKRLTLHIRLPSQLDALRRRREQGDVSSATAVDPRHYKDFSRLAKATGGDVVIVDQEELEQTVEFVTTGTKKAFILLAQCQETHNYSLPIDSTIKTFEVTVYSNDNVPGIRVLNAKGEDVEPSAIQEGLLFSKLTFQNGGPGGWKLSVLVPPEQDWLYTVAVQAVSDIKLHSRFFVADSAADTNHPGMQVLRERPLFGGTALLELKTSTKRSLNPIYVQTRDVAFQELDQFVVEAGKGNAFYANVKIPEQPFYLRVYGFDDAGYPFMRTEQDLIEPSNIFIEVSKPRRVDSVASPEGIGLTRYLADYFIRNEGPTALLGILVWDTANITLDYYPKFTVLVRERNISGEILLGVPANTTLTTTFFVQAKNAFEESSNIFTDILTFE